MLYYSNISRKKQPHRLAKEEISAILYTVMFSRIPHKKKTAFGLFVAILLAWTVLLWTVGPEQMVSYIGVQNGYLIGFFLATFGGMSTLSSASYFATIITLAAGGLNPYLLAVVAGFGLLIGDSLFFYLGKSGRTAITLAAGGLNPYLLAVVAGFGLLIGDSLFFYLGKSGRTAFSDQFHERLDRLTRWIMRRPNWLVPIIVYIYVGFTPLPNDIFMIALALSGYPYKKMVIPLLLGDITIVLITALLASHGIQFLGL